MLVDWTIYFNGYIILSSSPWPHLAGLWDVWPGGDLCGEGGSDTNVSGGQISCSKAGSTLHESWTWPWEPNGFDDRRRFCESSSKLCSRSFCCENMATSKFIFLQVSNPLISNVSCYLSSFRQGQLWAWWCEEIGKMVGYPYGPWSVHHLLRWILEPPVGQHALQLEIVSFQVFEMAIALGAGTLTAMMIKMNHSVILCLYRINKYGFQEDENYILIKTLSLVLIIPGTQDVPTDDGGNMSQCHIHIGTTFLELLWILPTIPWADLYASEHCGPTCSPLANPTDPTVCPSCISSDDGSIGATLTDQQCSQWPGFISHMDYVKTVPLTRHQSVQPMGIDYDPCAW